MSSPAPVPDDNQAYRFPVSVKGVLICQSRVALLQNGRGEWELPGGKLEPGETPQSCLAREIAEELNLRAGIGPVLDTWVYTIAPGVEVLIVTYGCYLDSFDGLAHSAEHKAARLFLLGDVAELNMPQGYKDSITRWASQTGTDTAG